MNKFILILICLGLFGCSDSGGHYYKTDRQYRLESEIDDLSYENENLQDQVYELENETYTRGFNDNESSGYYSEYGHLSNDEIQYEIDDREDQIYDNEMEIIDKKYELDMTYID